MRKICLCVILTPRVSLLAILLYLLLLFFFSDEACQYLLTLFNEEDAIFGDMRPDGGPPIVVNRTMIVEGVPVCGLMEAKEDQLLTWGACFAVFAQTPTTRRFENVACLMTRYVLRTDEGRVPKKLSSVSQKLHL